VTGTPAHGRALMWRRLDGCGMEHCRVSEGDAGVSLDGGVVVYWQGVSWRVEYDVRCDRSWRTREVRVRAHAGAETHDLKLHADGDGRWNVGGELRADLQGCWDVDLGFSPSTNTLPIRRLELNVEQSETIQAAWVEFPSLAVRRVPQRYTRVAGQTYRYENLLSSFVSTLDVDASGLVVSYPPGWEQIGNHTQLDQPLFSTSPAAELGHSAALYAGLIGSWDVEVIDFDDDGTARTKEGEWHFGWALEGRAVQDVFIVPKRGQRADTGGSRCGNRYGTTLRYFDPVRRAWRITWINPVTGAYNRLDARQEGDVIIQEGADDDGKLLRWSFVELARERFHWIGEESTDGSASWRKRAEFFGRRTSFQPLR
jgi:uncharacterized protein